MAKNAITLTESDTNSQDAEENEFWSSILDPAKAQLTFRGGFNTPPSEQENGLAIPFSSSSNNYSSNFLYASPSPTPTNSQQEMLMQQQQQQQQILTAFAQQHLFNPNLYVQNNQANLSEFLATAQSTQQNSQLATKRLTVIIQRIASSTPASISADNPLTSITPGTGGIIYSINEEMLPKHVFGGQSSQGQRTLITVSFEVNQELLKELVEVLIFLAKEKNPLLSQEAFQQLCYKSRIRVKQDELLSKVSAAQSRKGAGYSSSSVPWKADVTLIKMNKNNVVERPAGLQKGTTANMTNNDNGALIEDGTAPFLRKVEFSNITLEETSSNRPICKLRYKIIFDGWLECFCDGEKVFQVKCTKTSVLQKQKQQRMRTQPTSPQPPVVAPITTTIPKEKKQKSVDVVPQTPKMEQFDPKLVQNLQPLITNLQNNPAVFAQALQPPMALPQPVPLTVAMHHSAATPVQTAHMNQLDLLDIPQQQETKLNSKSFIDEIVQQLRQHTKEERRDFYINPMKGSCRGGDFVFIEIRNSKIQINKKGTSPMSKIYFGDAEAQIVQTNPNSFFVKTPPHSEGKVSVTILSGDIMFADTNELIFEFNGGAEDFSELVDYSGVGMSKRRLSDGGLEALEVQPSAKKQKLHLSPLISSSPSSSSEGETGIPSDRAFEITPSPTTSFSPACPSPSPQNLTPAPKRKSSVGSVSKKSLLSTVYNNCWAIVIGINEYQAEKFSVLSSAVKDAMRMASILQHNYSYKVFTLFNQDATKNKIYQLFEEVADKVQPEDCILVYFAGHGLFKQYKSAYVSGYMCPWDCNPDNLPSTGISYKIFKEIHEWFSAKHVLFMLDACYAGNLFKMRGAFNDKTEVEYFAKNRAVQLICASSDIHQAAEDSFGGLFSSWLVEALKQGLPTQSKRKQYFTAEQLAVWVQEKVIASTEGKQIPQYGKLEVGDGQYMFFPSSSGKGYNPELERVISLINIHQEYLHNVNVGDIEKYPELLHLVKSKFNQITKFYLEHVQSLLKDNLLILDSNIYINFRLNLDEILEATKYCYLAVFSDLPDWMSYRKYYLADINHQMIKKNNVVVKRIFILRKDLKYSAQDEIIKMMKYHSEKGIDVRVVYTNDVEDRMDIPRNFSIIDFKLSHVLMKEDGYPKSAIIFNPYCIERYYSFWLHLYQKSLSLNQFLSTHGIPKVAVTIMDKDALPQANSIAANKSLTAESHVIQQHLNPMLQKYKEKIQSFLTIKTQKKHLTDQAKQLVLEKFQKLNMFYENTLANFFSEGKLVTHSKFFDNHRFRLYEMEKVCTKSYHGLINEDMVLKYESNDITTFFTYESTRELADTNWRLTTQKQITCKRVFILKKRQDGSVHQKMIELLNYHQERLVKVYVVEMSEKEMSEFPGSFVILDKCILGSNSFLYPETTTHFEESQSNYYFMKNRLSANEEEITRMFKMWKDLKQRSVPYETFKLMRGLADPFN